MRVQLHPGSTRNDVAVAVSSLLPEWQRQPKFAMRTLKNLSQAKLPGAAWHVLQIMEEASIETNVFHYSAAINACEKAGEWMLALAVVVGMQEKEVMPNTVTMNSAISACEKAEEWTWALHFLDAMPGTSLTRDVISYTSTMNACAKAFLWETALQLFDSMSLEAVVPNTRTYNGAISAFAQAGRWRPALQMLDVMASRALKPNTFSYNAALNACDKGGQWQWAIHLLFYMQQHKVPLDHVSYCTAMTALARDGHWMEAILLLGTMPRPTAAAFTAVISSCERSSQWQVALDVLFSDGHAHLMPYNAAASACEKGTQWPMALHLFASAHTRTLRADVGTLNSVMVACEKGSEWERALTALQLLPLEVTIAAVAEGLTQASKQAVKGCLLPVEWLGMFLRTPGHAPAHILNAIFQSHSLKYFDFENQRQDANMAHFENSSYLNVKEGMPFEEFNDYFVSRQQIGNEGVRLLRGLGVDFSRRSQRADPSQDEVEHYEWDYATGAQMVVQFETNQRSNYRPLGFGTVPNHQLQSFALAVCVALRARSCEIHNKSTQGVLS